MTVGDVATLLQVHPETVRRLTRRRELRGHSVGGQWRYLRAEVEEDVRAWGEHRRAYYKHKPHR
jgi:excisionase family DNA binding protein